MTDTRPNPKLLKERQYHSRIFAVVLVAVLLIAHPILAGDSTLRLLMSWIGYGLVIFGALGRVYSSCFIGGRKNDEIVRAGPFSIVRNPLYVFSFLAMVGIGLQSGMLLVTAVLIVAFILYYPLVVAKEEKFLEHKFGESYVKYKQEVPRWFPNFSLWNEPEHVDAMPKFIRKTMLDASIFFLPLLGFSLIAELQAKGVLPAWIPLP